VRSLSPHHLHLTLTSSSNQDLRRRIAKIPNLSFDASPAALSEIVSRLKDIPVRPASRSSQRHLNSERYLLWCMQDPVQRAAILQAFSKAISLIWVVNTPFAGFALILGMKHPPLLGQWPCDTERLHYPTVLFLREYSMKRTAVRADGDVENPKTQGESADNVEKGPEMAKGQESHLNEAETSTSHQQAQEIDGDDTKEKV
jgi:hypothetical protein